jgi:hypothetical protein
MAILAKDCMIKASWLIVTPLGFPVVPRVKNTTISEIRKCIPLRVILKH